MLGPKDKFDLYEPLDWQPSDLPDDWYEPNDYEDGDIGSATVKEMRLQNGDY